MCVRLTVMHYPSLHNRFGLHWGLGWRRRIVRIITDCIEPAWLLRWQIGIWCFSLVWIKSLAAAVDAGDIDQPVRIIVTIFSDQWRGFHSNLPYEFRPPVKSTLTLSIGSLWIRVGKQFVERASPSAIQRFKFKVLSVHKAECIGIGIDVRTTRHSSAKSPRKSDAIVCILVKCRRRFWRQGSRNWGRSNFWGSFDSFSSLFASFNPDRLIASLNSEIRRQTLKLLN